MIKYLTCFKSLNGSALDLILMNNSHLYQKRQYSVPLTDCINSATLSGVFADELKLADVTPLYKKSDTEDETNY